MKEESEWASTILDNCQTAKVYYYQKKHENVERIIKDKVTFLCEWEMPDYPEDLSLFKKGKVGLQQAVMKKSVIFCLKVEKKLVK